LDAEVLARSGEAVRPEARPLANEQAQALEDSAIRGIEAKLAAYISASLLRCMANQPDITGRHSDSTLTLPEYR
jgi:hypothetical protein